MLLPAKGHLSIDTTFIPPSISIQLDSPFKSILNLNILLTKFWVDTIRTKSMRNTYVLYCSVFITFIFSAFNHRVPVHGTYILTYTVNNRYTGTLIYDFNSCQVMLYIQKSQISQIILKRLQWNPISCITKQFRMLLQIPRDKLNLARRGCVNKTWQLMYIELMYIHKIAFAAVSLKV